MYGRQAPRRGLARNPRKSFRRSLYGTRQWGPGKWLGNATKLGAAAVMVGYGFPAMAGKSGAAAGTWWKGAGKQLGNTIWQSGLSGLSKRVEAQIAGDKGAYASPTGYALPYQAQASMAQQAAAATQQTESQGQYFNFMAQENEKNRAHDLTMLMLQLQYANGSPENGERPGPFAPFDKQLDKVLIKPWKAAVERGLSKSNRPIHDIGMTGDGRHYGVHF